MYAGPHNKQSDLVFGYDSGEQVNPREETRSTRRRFFKGEPKTNLWDSIDNTQSLRGNRTEHFWNGKKWIVNGTYTHPNIKGPRGKYLGKVFKFTSGALNSTWSGNSYGYMLRDIATTNGSTHTVSFWVYASPDCNVTAIPAVIEQEAGGESTVSGFNAEYNLSNKGTWQRIAKKATADDSVRFLIYPRRNGVTDGSFSGFFMWAAPQVVIGDRPVPYVQTGTTRASTDSLIDLARSTSIQTSTISFNSSGLPTFDGTDDVINVNPGTFPSSFAQAFSIEVIYYVPSSADWSAVSGRLGCIVARGGYAGVWGLCRYTTNNRLGFYMRTGSGSTTYDISTDIERDKYYHILATWNGSNRADLYLNGELKHYEVNSYTGTTCDNTGNIKIGGGISFSGSAGGFPEARIPVVKIYSSMLTPQQVKTNYLSYSRRFNL